MNNCYHQRLPITLQEIFSLLMKTTIRHWKYNQTQKTPSISHSEIASNRNRKLLRIASYNIPVESIFSFWIDTEQIFDWMKFNWICNMYCSNPFYVVSIVCVSSHLHSIMKFSLVGILFLSIFETAFLGPLFFYLLIKFAYRKPSVLCKFEGNKT